MLNSQTNCCGVFCIARQRKQLTSALYSTHLLQNDSSCMQAELFFCNQFAVVSSKSYYTYFRVIIKLVSIWNHLSDETLSFHGSILD